MIIKNIDELKPYKNNARKHDENQIEKIARSIKEFGFTNPILIDRDSNILAGHGRLMAAKKLGMKEVPTISLENLSGVQARAYIIADNKLSDVSEFNKEILKLEMIELKEIGIDLTLLGFETFEIEEIVHDMNFEPVSFDEQGKLDSLNPKIVNCPNCGHSFDANKK